MNMNERTTIAAISTAMSNSGIGIVRMSGDQAFQIADIVYRGRHGKKLMEQKSHTIHYGYIVDGEETIDEVLVMLMRGPHSYTGEDTVEINCHGGVFVVKRILELLIKSGARPAEPGEFTKKAFLNGRLDLSQAEAVGDLIASQNEYALQSSVNQLKGNIRDKISDLRNKIIYHTAFIESALDDPEHISVDGYGEELESSATEMMEEIKKLIDSADDGRILKEGINTVILGKPNVGKSSLINGLMNRKSLARTSSAPGKTQTINFYAVTGRRETKKEAQGMVSADEKVYLVDLPGYGYAKVSQNEKQKWGKMIEDYLHKSSQLKAVFLLIDIRHDPSANDKQMYDWVLHNGFSPIIIATKLDKIKRSQVQKQVKAIKQGLQVEKGTLVIPFSAETKQGREEIWSVIEGYLDAK